MHLYEYAAKRELPKKGVRIAYRLQIYFDEWQKAELMSTATTGNSDTPRAAQLTDNHDNLTLGEKQSQPGSAGSGLTSGMACQQNSAVRPIAVRQVDHKTLAGSNPGDHRTNAAPVSPLAGNDNSPREQMGQQRSSNKLDTPGVYTSEETKGA